MTGGTMNGVFIMPVAGEGGATDGAKATGGAPDSPDTPTDGTSVSLQPGHISRHTHRTAGVKTHRNDAEEFRQQGGAVM